MEWITILKCPVTGNDLRMLTPEEIAALNNDISKGLIGQADNGPVTITFEQALITLSGDYVYPMVDGIILLLKNLALVGSVKNIREHPLSPEKQQVKNFYDHKGWAKDEEGNYQDAVIYEDLREVSRGYIKKCHRRVSRFLNPAGKYLLDAASGPLQYPEYLSYSANYSYRVCVDLSFQALVEARKKLGDRGLYVLCDMANMPFKDEVMDGFVSLNTVYHIPKDEQVSAVQELYRVLAKGGKGIVVYDWFKHSRWMNFWMLPFRGFVFIKNRLADSMQRLLGTTGVNRRLYFYAHTAAYFERTLPPYQLQVWRSLSVPFMRYYIHPWLFGRQILEWVYNKEERDPEVCGRNGEYPMLVFEKRPQAGTNRPEPVGGSDNP